MKVSTELKLASASLTLDVGSLLTAAASPRRFKLGGFTFGSDAAADNQWRVEIQKRTGVATNGTAPTIVQNDQNDTIASTLVANQAPTANGAGSGVYLGINTNQRSSVQFWWIPGYELVSVVTASNGFGVNTPVGSATVALVSTLFADEL